MNEVLTFGWLDLIAPVPELAEDFYRDLFGWELEPLDVETVAGYQMFTCNGEPVAGLIAADREDTKATAAWLPSLLCDNLDASAMKADELGGEASGETTDLPGIGRTIVMRDPQMAAIALLAEDGGGDPLATDGDPGTFTGCDLLTSNLKDAATFYTGLCNWETAAGDISHRRSITFASNGTKIAGAWEAPGDGARAWWVPSVAVSDLRPAVERASRLGAQIIIPPITRNDGRDWAVILDAVGAPVGMLGPS